MDEQKIMELFEQLDQDLVESEVDELMKEVDYDSEAIKEKALGKVRQLNKKRALIGKIVKLTTVAACVSIALTSFVFRENISAAFKGFFGQRSVGTGVVVGDGYELEEPIKLSEDILVKSAFAFKDTIEVDVETDLSLKQLDPIQLIARHQEDDSDEVDVYYEATGYSVIDKGYHFLFAKDEINTSILVQSSYTLVLAGKNYDIQLEQGEEIQVGEEVNMETKNEEDPLLKGIHLAYRELPNDEKLQSFQILVDFEDDKTQLLSIGMPSILEAVGGLEYPEDGGIISWGSSGITDPLIAYDTKDNKYEVEYYQQTVSLPRQSYYIDAGDTQVDGIKKIQVPAILTTYKVEKQKREVDLPESGVLTMDEDINLGLESIKIKEIERVDETTVNITLLNNTQKLHNVWIRSVQVDSGDIRKMECQFTREEAKLTIELKEKIDTLKLDFYNPEYIWEGNWTVAPTQNN